MNIVGRVLLVLVVAALAGAAAIGFSAQQPKEYQAGMQFQFGQLLSPELSLLGPDFGTPDVDEEVYINTEAAGLNSDDVGDATARRHPELGYTAGEINGRTVAAANRTTLIIDLRSRADSPQRAARLVAAYGEQYLALRRGRERKQAANAQAVLRESLRRVPREERGTLRAATLQNKIADLQVLKETGSGNPKVITTARASSAKVQPQTARNVVFALLFGLAIGIGMVALRSENRSRARRAAARRVAARTGADRPGT